MEKKKKNVILLAITVSVLLIALVGASYAYFAATIGSGSTTPVTVQAKTLDTLTFNNDTELTLTLNQDNMAQGLEATANSVTRHPSVSLQANNNASATYCYNATLNISSNNFVRTSATADLQFNVGVQQYTNATQSGSTFTGTGGTMNVLINERELAGVTSNIQIPIASGGTNYKFTITAAAGTLSAHYFTVTVNSYNSSTVSQNSNVGHTLSASIVFTKVSC